MLLATVFGLSVGLVVVPQAHAEDGNCRPFIRTGDKKSMSYSRQDILYTVHIWVTAAVKGSKPIGEFELFKDGVKAASGPTQVFEQACGSSYTEVVIFVLDPTESYPLDSQASEIPIEGPPGSVLYILGKRDGFSIEVAFNSDDGTPLVTLLPSRYVWKDGIVSPQEMKAAFDAQYNKKEE
jgi:hypothetical protein